MVKKIHYIWLGGNPKSSTIRRCIKSWKTAMPDWEIIEWNEQNLNLNETIYCRKAYDCKKYAFASDYFRFKILNEYGGLYLDTDVELLCSVENILSRHQIVMGFENEQFINPGLICYASKPQLPLIAEIVSSYEDEVFQQPDGTLNLFTICERVTPILKKMGFKINDTYQEINGIALYPHEYFCPTDYVWSRQDFTKKTCSIHHYDASWGNPCSRIRNNFKKIIYKIFKPTLVKAVLSRVRKWRELFLWEKC